MFVVIWYWSVSIITIRKRTCILHGMHRIHHIINEVVNYALEAMSGDEGFFAAGCQAVIKYPPNCSDCICNISLLRYDHFRNTLYNKFTNILLQKLTTINRLRNYWLWHPNLRLGEVYEIKLRHLKSPALKDNIKTPHEWLFLMEIHRWWMHSPRKGSVMRKVFPVMTKWAARGRSCLSY